MSDGTTNEVAGVAENWPEEREWHPTDARWGEQPRPPVEDREPSLKYDRARCPLMPLQDYLVLRVDNLDFVTSSGLVVAADGAADGAGSSTPILIVVRTGPDVKHYKPGDFVITNPRNNELGWAWSDPRPPHTTDTYIMMREKVIIARIDHEVVEQLKCRGRYLKEQQKLREEAAEKEKAYRESDLNPNKGKELVDATGNPISKSGMHEENLPEGLTPDTPTQ